MFLDSFLNQLQCSLHFIEKTDTWWVYYVVVQRVTTDRSIINSVWLRIEYPLISSSQQQDIQSIVLMVETSFKFTEVFCGCWAIQPPPDLVMLESIMCFCIKHKNVLSDDWNPRETMISWCYRVNSASEICFVHSWSTKNHSDTGRNTTA